MSQRKGAKTTASVELPPNDAESRREMERHLFEEVERQGYPAAAQFPLRLAIEEAVMNAFKHGHRNLPEASVKVTWSVEPARVTISVEDQGPGFVPDDVPDPTSPELLEKPSGRGLMLMRAYMAKIEYSPRGNKVTMVYERPQG